MNKNSIAKIVFTTIVFLLGFSKGYPQLSPDSIRQIIEREVINKRSASIAVGIIDTNGRQFFSYGKMSDSNNSNPDENTMYEIGSITKVFTSLLLADLAMKNELNPEDPISKFLPKTVKCPVRNGKEIRLIDLATHTSGLPYGNPDNLNPKDVNNPWADYSEEQMYDFLSNYKLPRDIGSKYEYSSFGVGLLGHILALKTGIGYETMVTQRIAKPLDMKSTVITLTPALKEKLAIGHNKYGKPVNLWDMPTQAGSAALRSNVNDLLNFLSANLEIIQTDMTPAIRLTHVTQDSTGIFGMSIAMGWHILKKYGREIHFHIGGIGGYKTFIGFDKEIKTGVVVLSSTANDIDDIAFHLLCPKLPVNAYHYKWLLMDTLRRTVTENGIHTVRQVYYSLKQIQPSGFLFDEEQLENLGYEFLDAKKLKEAIVLFELNAIEYPQSWSAYDSLGEAYMSYGDKKLAIENYQKSVELNPGNVNGKNMLKKLKAL